MTIALAISVAAAHPTAAGSQSLNDKPLTPEAQAIKHKIALNKVQAEARAAGNMAAEKAGKQGVNERVKTEAAANSAIASHEKALEKTKELNRKRVDKVKEVEKEKTKAAEKTVDNLKSVLKKYTKQAEAKVEANKAHTRANLSKAQTKAENRSESTEDALKSAILHAKETKAILDKAATNLNAALKDVSDHPNDELKRHKLNQVKDEMDVAAIAEKKALTDMAEKQHKSAAMRGVADIKKVAAESAAATKAAKHSLVQAERLGREARSGE